MQALIVYAIVAVAAVYAAWLLMPAPVGRRVLAWLRRFAPAGAQPLLARMDAEDAGCGTFKGCATDAKAPRDARIIEMRRR
jgi:hypothetical protein